MIVAEVDATVVAVLVAFFFAGLTIAAWWDTNKRGWSLLGVGLAFGLIWLILTLDDEEQEAEQSGSEVRTSSFEEQILKEFRRGSFKLVFTANADERARKIAAVCRRAGGGLVLPNGRTAAEQVDLIRRQDIPDDAPKSERRSAERILRDAVRTGCA